MKTSPLGVTLDELCFVAMSRELSPAQLAGLSHAMWKLVGPAGRARLRRQGITPLPAPPGLFRDEESPPPPVDPSPRSGRRRRFEEVPA